MPEIVTTSTGTPIGKKSAVLSVGPRGPMLLQDVVFMDEMAHFDRERIPERVVHAKGAGAHGYFEVTHDISKYCKAKVFDKIGKRTPLFVRFSTVGGESGSADTARDPRGFAIKFYTEEGNWDLVGNNTPIFFIRDPILFPNFIHTQKRNPVTHLKDPNAVWDFFTLRPESMHQVMILYGDRGIPDGYRFMNGYGSNTFKMVNNDGEAVYCKFHVKSAQGIRNLTMEEAARLAGEDPDYAIRDLSDSINKRNYPQWNFMIQVMTFDEAQDLPFNPFDVTKVWPHKQFPLIPVGKIILNRNPSNYFAEVEQAAFAPAHVVPGIEFSPDKMLQGRLFAYTDTQFHRLGPNHAQLPINSPHRSKPHNTQRDGLMAHDNQGADPNYFPNSHGSLTEQPNALESNWNVNGDVARYDTHDEDNFSQARDLWVKVMDDGAHSRFVAAVVADLKQCNSDIQERAIKYFKHVDVNLSNLIQNALEEARKESAKTFQPEGNVMMVCTDDRDLSKMTNIEKYTRY